METIKAWLVGAVVASLSIWIIAALIEGTKSAKPVVLKVHTYNLKIGEDVTSWQGTSIRANGFCSEILMGNHVDTVICQAHLITEVPEPQPTPPPTVQVDPAAPAPPVRPTLLEPNGHLEARS